MADVMSVLEVIDMERRKDLQGLISALNYQAKAAVRAEAAMALGRLGDHQAVQPLIEVLNRDSDPYVRSLAAKSLGQLGDPSAQPALRRAFASDTLEVGAEAGEALTALRSHQVRVDQITVQSAPITRPETEPRQTTETKSAPSGIETVGEPAPQSASGSAPRPPVAAGARPGCVTAYAALLGLVAISAAIVGLTTGFDFAILLWLGMAIPFGMVARSLWQMKNWARVLVILVHGFGIFPLAVIAAGSVSGDWERISVIVISVALSVWTVYWFATHGTMFMGTTQPARLSESFVPRTFADGAAFIVPEGRGWRCSACGGFVRQDARSCKTCHKPFQQSDMRSFLEGAQIDLGTISLVSASFVSIPLKNLIVLRGLDDDPLLTTHKIELKMGPEIVFPSACAWCRSSSVVQQREIQLRQEVKMQDASVGKQVAGLLLGQISLGAGAMVSLSGRTQNAVVNLELTLPACQEHAATPELPNLHIRDFDPKREICLLDLGDADYAAAFCRQNAMSDPNYHRIGV